VAHKKLYLILICLLVSACTQQSNSANSPNGPTVLSDANEDEKSNPATTLLSNKLASEIEPSTLTQVPDETGTSSSTTLNSTASTKVNVVSSSTSAIASPRQPFNNADAQKQVLDATNAERAKVGCSPLVADSKLNSSADGHAEDMAAKNYFAHNSQDGRTFDQRISAAGFKFGSAGENLAVGQSTVSKLLQDWMASPGHRKNIVNCDYTNLGVGYAFSNYGGVSKHYWVQNFASQP